MAYPCGPLKERPGAFRAIVEPARAIIKSAIELIDDSDEYLFPSPLSAEFLSKATR